MHSIDVDHPGLGTFRRVYGFAATEAARRAGTQKRLWESQWQRRRDLKARLEADAVLSVAFRKAMADEASDEAENDIASTQSILADALRMDIRPDWSAVYDRSAFTEKPPLRPGTPACEPEPVMEPVPRSLATLFSRSRRQRVRNDALAAYTEAHLRWEHVTDAKTRAYQQAVEVYEAAFADWRARKSAFEAAQNAANARIDAVRAGYEVKAPDAVVATCNLALLALDRPRGFPCFWQLSIADGKLAIDYDLPSVEQMPWLKSVGYVRPRNAFERTLLDDSVRSRLYHNALFQSCLAVLHVLFRTDTANVIEAIAFNGWRNGFDRLGCPQRTCILAVEVQKNLFGRINLTAIDPEVCFRALNGRTIPHFDAL